LPWLRNEHRYIDPSISRISTAVCFSWPICSVCGHGQCIVPGGQYVYDVLDRPIDPLSQDEVAKLVVPPVLNCVRTPARFNSHFRSHSENKIDAQGPESLQPTHMMIQDAAGTAFDICYDAPLEASYQYDDSRDRVRMMCASDSLVLTNRDDQSRRDTELRQTAGLCFSGCTNSANPSRVTGSDVSGHGRANSSRRAAEGSFGTRPRSTLFECDGQGWPVESLQDTTTIAADDHRGQATIEDCELHFVASSVGEGTVYYEYDGRAGV
jgi:hypothetical protein